MRIKSENCFVMLQQEAFLHPDVLCEGLPQTFRGKKGRAGDKNLLFNELREILFCIYIVVFPLQTVWWNGSFSPRTNFHCLPMERRVFALLLEVLQGAELRRPPDPGWNPLIGFWWPNVIKCSRDQCGPLSASRASAAHPQNGGSASLSL